MLELRFESLGENMKDKIIKLYTEKSIDANSLIELMYEYLNSEHILRYLEHNKLTPDDMVKVYNSVPEALRQKMTQQIINTILPFANVKYEVSFLKDKDNNIIKVF